MIETYNRRFRKQMIVIHPGEFYNSERDVIISTVLGSCVSVVLYDQKKQYCGINHFMLPGLQSSGAKNSGSDGRYGTQAMELLIGTMIKNGSEPASLQAKIFGGGHVLSLQKGALNRSPKHFSVGRKSRKTAGAVDSEDFLTSLSDLSADMDLQSVPAHNIRFAFSFLQSEGIPIIAYDTGGTWGRKILVFSREFRVLLKRFHGMQASLAAQEELRYLEELKQSEAAQLAASGEVRRPGSGSSPIDEFGLSGGNGET